METSVKHRLIEYLKFKGIGQNKFEKIADISNGYITNIKGEIGVTNLTKILNAAPDLNREWLLTGDGDMLCSGNTQSADNANAPVCQNNGNNVTQNAGAPSATIDALIEEMKAQRILHEKLQEASNTQIDRLLSIIEKITNK